MSFQKTEEHIKHIVKIVDFFKTGKGTINKMDNHSDYQNSNYTPEDILGQIKYAAEQALKELNRD
ncbi:hypothetical protein [Listeria welshimeri]|uniref:hypothetical protein n=1 Tax=Listeria welshimeri TaxID=1643 RepID=UPI0018877716|nr:hypothetical protein [Listeria welshimeri]MBF2468051.1 hypothetical protein [Listeria welshimeri]MBF2593624.1 hypothetical protein [Listeria welshimeri]